jgi:hypothetical protein
MPIDERKGEQPEPVELPEDRAKRLEAMGFRKVGRRKAQPVVTGDV